MTLTSTSILHLGTPSLMPSQTVTLLIQRASPLSLTAVLDLEFSKGDQKLLTCKDKQQYPSIYLLNSTSLRKVNAIQHLSTELTQFRVDVALIVEIWFCSGDSDALFQIDGYTLFRRDRVCRVCKRRGGICAYIRSDINCKVVHPYLPCSDLFEIMWLKWQYCNTLYILALCYHPPQSCV